MREVIKKTDYCESKSCKFWNKGNNLKWWSDIRENSRSGWTVWSKSAKVSFSFTVNTHNFISKPV